MERDGLVERTLYPEAPPRVEYRLTEAGLSLRDPLRVLELWAASHMDAILRSRQPYDRAPSVP